MLCNKKKIISIIIATYNAEATLQRCLSSIIQQLNEDVELIVIDGGSIDNTLVILNDSINWISKLISEPDLGIYDAWNKGVLNSSGDWIMFIGSDDIINPGALDVLLDEVKSLNDGPFNFLSAKADYRDKLNRPLKIVGNSYTHHGMKKSMSISHVGALHRRILFEKDNKFNLKYQICADYEFLLRNNSSIKPHFIDFCSVKMQTGGISFTSKAIKEAFTIRKSLNSVSFFYNYYLFIKQYFLFKFFKLRYRL